mmetsp:Transcript_18657/g.30290  ORF Transcript_18657/g.30290 Transcript_18657/m.30290 type:complete len:178 (+) Transcript_18657:121-654(+)
MSTASGSGDGGESGVQGKTPGETELIGSILADTDADGDSHQSLFAQITRSISAPPQISARVQELEDGKFIDSRSGEKIGADDPRLTPEYYQYYYSQKPLDPRLPPPLYNWSSKQVASKFQGGKFSFPNTATVEKSTAFNNSRDNSTNSSKIADKNLIIGPRAPIVLLNICYALRPGT